MAYVVAGLGGTYYPDAVIDQLVQDGYTVHTPYWNSTDPTEDFNGGRNDSDPGSVSAGLVNLTTISGSVSISAFGQTYSHQFFPDIVVPKPPFLGSLDVNIGSPATDTQFVQAVVDDLTTHYDSTDTVVLIGHSLGGNSVLDVANDLVGKPSLDGKPIHVALLGLLDPVGFIPRSEFQQSLSYVLPVTFMQNGQVIGIPDPVPGFRSGLGSVPNDVGIFFNRWQQNGAFPLDYLVDGTLASAARVSDQEAVSDTDTRPLLLPDDIFSFVDGDFSFDPSPGSIDVSLTNGVTYTPNPNFGFFTSQANHQRFPTYHLHVQDDLIPYIPVAPTAVAKVGSPQPAFEGDIITLDGSGSSDPNPGQTATLEYDWTERSGPFPVSLAAVQKPTFTPGDNGNFVFQLVVTDDSGLASTRRSLRSTCSMSLRPSQQLTALQRGFAGSPPPTASASPIPEHSTRIRFNGISATAWSCRIATPRSPRRSRLFRFPTRPLTRINTPGISPSRPRCATTTAVPTRRASP